MITVVLIDDERPALRELEFLLTKYPEISVIGTFADPFLALEEIGQLKPQVVFLDINMPQLRGIDAATRILDGSPNTDIIFVTAFDQYALEAFELNALDYLLKPISIARLDKTIERVSKKKPITQKSRPQILKIKCFGRFKIGWENQEPIKWRSEKTKELFAFLLLNEGRDLSKEELLDKLWTEDDPHKAIRQLYNGIYYIRKALEGYGVDSSLISIDKNYGLKVGRVDSDVVRFDELAKGNYAESIESLVALEALYTGDYLEGEYYPWVEIERERLAKLHRSCLIKLSKKLIEQKQGDRAETYLMKAYNRNPYEQYVTELLLKLYLERGDQGIAIKHFNTYASIIKQELGIEVPRQLQGFMQSLWVEG